MKRGLSPKQRQFVREYLIDLNGTQAAIRAGYSPHTENEQAAQLLARLSIKRAVREALKARAARTEATADDVIRELLIVAKSDIGHYEVSDKGRLRVGRHADPGARRAVSSFKRKTRTIPTKDGEPIVEVETEIRLWPKVQALITLAQHLGMLKTNAPDPLNELLNKLPADIRSQLRALFGKDSGPDPVPNDNPA